jgi:hypothetical protein
LGDDETGSEASTDLGSEGLELLRATPDGSSVGAAFCETLIIFDWDDTLFPTSWLHQHDLLQEGATISQEQDAQLQKLADSALATLRAAKRLGGVAIVTNAEQGWVELSCGTFLASLEAELTDVRIVSARSDHEKHGLFAPTTWKCLAFSEVADEFYNSLDCTGAVTRNIVSLGDSEHEMEALKWITSGTDCFAKSLKFVHKPSVEQLLEQHELVAGCLEDVVEHGGNLDYEVGVED